MVIFKKRNKNVTIKNRNEGMGMKKIAKRIVVVALMVMVIFTMAVGSAPREVEAASYSGKIYKHWCKLRTKKSKSSKTIMKLKVGTKVTVHSTSGQWRKVTVKGKTGYVLKKYVYINTSAPKLTGSTYSKGKTVASFAQRFVGNPYKWGGTNLNSGADCSGFVKSVYKSFGYNLPRTSSSLRSAGRKVSYSKKQPGDLICYSGHVAIYIGNGKIVHASSAKTGIKISSKANYRKVLSVRRIVK